jgi:hypothetical protein
MKSVRTGGRNYGHLPVRRTALSVGAEILRLHLEFLDGIERNVQAHVFPLLLIVYGGRVDSVERQIVIVQPMSREANSSLISGAVINGAWRERG